VVSLRPELNEQNQMQLEMKVAGDTRAAAVELVHRMEGSKHFQSAQLVQEMGTEEGTGVIASVVSRSMFRMRPRGAESNARLGEFAAQVENCDWGDAGRRCDRGGGRSVLAAGRFGGLAEAQIQRTAAELTKKTHEVAPLRGMDKKIVLAKGQISDFYKDRFAAKDSDLLDELGKTGGGKWRPHQQAHYKEEEAETPA
jgi:hypothetical protein